MSESAGRLETDFAARHRPWISSDVRLAQLAARGDERAFSAMYRKYHQELYRYCRAILHDPNEAEDALQQTMVKALRSLPGETREIALRPWLYRVAHNEAISILRARRPVAEIDPERVELGADVEGEAATRERLRHLFADIQQLPERQRGALVMRELSGLSFGDIGAAFGLRPAAAKQAVYEARLSLQEMAEGHEMECEAVRQSISAQDRRLLRSRRIRSHLRTCVSCRGFDAAIDARRRDVAMLAPPLAAPAALALLYGALGAANGGAAAAGAAAGVGGGTAAGALGGTIVIKSVAAGLAGLALAGGAAEVGGLIDLGGSTRDNRNVSAPPTTSVEPQSPTPGTATEPSGEAGSSTSANHGVRPSDDGGEHEGRGAADEHRGPNGVAHGHQGTQPGQTKPGQGPAAPAPGQSHSNAGGQSAAHSNAGGQSAAHSNAGGHAATHSNSGGKPVPSGSFLNPTAGPAAGEPASGNGSGNANGHK